MKQSRILIVDDKEENRYLLRVLLSADGHALEEATQGAEALEMARRSPPDLIISDVLMPVMDGFALCREWKRDPLLGPIPFLFYTATCNDERDRKFGLSLGAAHFIVKPEEPDSLIHIVRDTLRPTQPPPASTPPPAPPAPSKGDPVFLKQYNEALIRRLEAQMEALEQANRQLEQDIAERRRVEEELRRTNASLDSIIENLPGMLFLKDARDLRFLRFNRAGEELVGRPRSELIGKNDHDLFPPDQADFFSRMDREILQSKTVKEIPEEPLQTRFKGTRILHTWKVPVLNADGEPEYLLGISEDITDRKQAQLDRERMQAQLTQAQKMESVGRLAGGVAHDFNNMLGAILGHAELALEDMRPDHPLFSDLMEILKATRRSSDLTRQLLAFARKQTVSPQILHLDKTVADMLQLLRRLIGEDIKLSWRPAPDLWPVKIDPSQIDQILANLCVNARDAIAGVGQISIEARNASFDDAFCAAHPGFRPGDHVLLSVSDTGCGMDPATQSKLFEPFFTTKGVGQGTGLGLATVYGVVQQNNGFLHVESEPGRGSTFQIYLPRHAGAEEAPPPRPAEPALPRGQETILFVEDEPAILQTGAIMLKRLGYRVLSAPLPSEALRLAKEHPDPIHLLLTDVVMPEMNGRELAQRILALRPNIPCLYMSGYTADVLAQHGVARNGDDFIQKPFSMTDLSEKIRHALAGA